MKRFLIISIISSVFTLNLFAQSFNIGFSAHGDSESVDSVIVRNLKVGNTIKLSGNDVLELIPGLALRNLKNANSFVSIYPNPTDNICYIEFILEKPGQTYITINDVTGKVIYKWSGNLSKSVHVFQLKGLGNGIFNINIKSESLLHSEKLIGLGEPNKALSLSKINEYSIDEVVHLYDNATKSSVTMPYMYGDLLLFEAISEEGYISLKTLILNEVAQEQPNRLIDFYFVKCIDNDFNIYKTVEIGDYVWMAEDLKTTKYRDNTLIPEIQNPDEWLMQTDGAWCHYDNNNSEVKLYNWYSVVNNRKVCPEGWHAPNDTEWKWLESAIGLSENSIDQIGWRGNDLSWKLKESGEQSWLSNTEEKTNLSGFSAKATGMRNFAGNFYYKNTNAVWWTASESSERNAWVRGLQYDNNSLFREDGNKIMGLTLRCMKNYLPTVETKPVSDIGYNSAKSGGAISDFGGGDIIAAGVVWGRSEDIDIDFNESFSSDYRNDSIYNSSLTNLEDSTKYYVKAYATNDAGTGYGEAKSFTSFKDPNADEGEKLFDIEGNKYDVITVGTHKIMGQNLKVTRLNDSTNIVNETQLFEWETSENNLYCWYDNNIANKDTYGALYNWHTVNSKKLCPTGWHVPTDNEWKQIEIELGMSEQDAEQQGSRGTNQGSQLAGFSDLWQSGELVNSSAFGESDINLIPSGFLDTYDGFYGLGNTGNYWCANEFSEYDAWVRELAFSSSGSIRVGMSKNYGVAVRCVQGELIINAPELTTLSVYNVSSNSAQCLGRVVDTYGNYISEFGVIWSTDPEPTFLNQSDFSFSEFVSDTVAFSLENLDMGVQYYVRAYAKYAEGVVYANILSFTTPVRGEDIVDADGNEYPTIKIGDDFWTNRNIKATHFNDGSSIPLISGEWQAKSDMAMAWYDDDETNGNIYGALYSWAVVQINPDGENNICPVGYHVATTQDWQNLIDNWGGEDFAGNPLKEFGTEHWYEGNEGTDLSGFTALPGGFKNITGEYLDLGKIARFWAADLDEAWAVNMEFASSGAYMSEYAKNYGFSARCVKDQTPLNIPNINDGSIGNITQNSCDVTATVTSTGGAPVLTRGAVWGFSPEPSIENNEGIINQGSGQGQFVCNLSDLEPNTVYYVRAFATNQIGTYYYDFPSIKTDYANIGTITDVDGNEYQTVTIGTQNWMRSNLKTTHYADNTPINEVSDNNTWMQLSEPAMCWYDNTQNDYGLLYNWYAVDFLNNGGKNICPNGWRMAKEDDWQSLINYLGDESIAGGKLKQEGIDTWLNPNAGADNYSGFTALPSGMRDFDGEFNGLGEITYFWSITENTELNAFSTFLTYEEAYAFTDWFEKNNAFAVRCIKVADEEALPVITTNAVTNISYSSAVFNGDLIADGNIAPIVKGFIWSSNPNVSLSQHIGIHTEEGLVGQFSFTLNEIEENTALYVRAFAVNPVGVVYGTEMNFTTPENIIAYDGDGNAYSVIKIGEQLWLKENLKTRSFNDGTHILNFSEDTIMAGHEGEPVFFSDYQAMMWYENDFATFGNEYGGLYNSMHFCNMMATNGKSLCPEGFHIPTYNEWNTLIDFVGENSDALKSVDYWSNSNPTDLFGFSALPSGYFINDFVGLGESTIWSIALSENETSPKVLIMSDDPQFQNNLDFIPLNLADGGNPLLVCDAASIRCIRNKVGTSVPNIVIDSIHSIEHDNAVCDFSVQNTGGHPILEVGLVWSTSQDLDLDYCNGSYRKQISGSNINNFSNYIQALNANETYYVKAYAISILGIGYSDVLSLTTTNGQTIFDGDGNEYDYVIIGNQKWLKENLKTTSFIDGTGIANLIDPYSWNDAQNGAYCWYGNDYSSFGEYGALYNFNAVNPIKNDGKYLCPEGWHVPTEFEWATLINYVGKYNLNDLRSTDYWSSATDSPDIYGFSAMGSGFRSNQTEFSSIDYETYFWSSTMITDSTSKIFKLDSYGYDAGIASQLNYNGLSVRCIRNGNYPQLSNISIEPPIEFSANTVSLRAITSGNQQDTIFGVGFVISQNPNVNLNNADYVLSVENVQDGSFVLNEYNLEELTTYYVKAFAVNVIGIAYSSEISFTTPIDNGIVDGSGNTYQIVEIDNTYWLSENLKADKFNDGTPIQNIVDDNDWNNAENAAYCVYNNDNAAYFDEYGCLYNRYVVNLALSKGKNICPVGFHVASSKDWLDLINAVGGQTAAGGVLKENGTAHWQDPNVITGDLGFLALPGGYRNEQGFAEIETSGLWWENVAAENDSSLFKFNKMTNNATDIINNVGDKFAGYSIRCVRNTELTVLHSALINSTDVSYLGFEVKLSVVNDGTLPLVGIGCLVGIEPDLNFDNAIQCIYDLPEDDMYLSVSNLQPSTTYYARGFVYDDYELVFTNIIQISTKAIPQPVDADGNVYDYAVIGNTVWLSENLKTTKFLDGTSVPYILDNAEWQSLNIPACSHYNNEPNENEYGLLYNNYVVTIQNPGKKICPSGWRVAKSSDWEELQNNLNSSDQIFDAAIYLKEEGDTHWNSPNNATNSSGFTALPGGYRNIDGTYFGINNTGAWWAAPAEAVMNFIYRMHNNSDAVETLDNPDKKIGASIRCVFVDFD